MSQRSGVFTPKRIGLAGLVLIALLVTVWKPVAHAPAVQKLKHSVVTQAGVPPGPRKVYPLSVIRGGAYTASELDRARRLDPVVNAHYISFGSHPIFKKTNRDLLMYVSYRQGKDVYWSQTRHRIPKGETLIADGAALARARCGNRLSAIPQSPVAVGKQPTEDVMNTPEAPEELASYELPALPGPVGTPFLMSFPAGFDAPVAGLPLGTTGPGGGGGPAAGGGGGFPGAPGIFGGGSGPLLGSGRYAKASSAPVATPATGGPGVPILGGIGPVNSPVVSPVQGVVISSNGFPTSPNYPVSPGKPGDTISELAPEPSPAVVTGFAVIILLLMSYWRHERLLRRQIR